jgi:hypothetical protein
MLSGLIKDHADQNHGEPLPIMSTNVPDLAAATPPTDRYSGFDKVVRKTRRKVILWLVGSLLVVGGCLGAVEWHYLTTRWAEDAKVGECLTSTGLNGANANGVKVVGCDDAKAYFRVIAITRDTSYFDACEEFPDAVGGIYIRSTSRSAAKTVCVEEIEHTVG